MARALVHRKLLGAIHGGVTPTVVTLTDPGTVIPTPSGGTTASGPTSVQVAASLGTATMQARQTIFGEQLAAQVDLIAILPAGTAVREGWTVAVGGATYVVQKVATSVAPGAPQWLALTDARLIGG